VFIKKLIPAFVLFILHLSSLQKEKKALKILVLYIFQCWLFCFSEWGIEEFGIPQTFFLPATS